MKGAPVFVLAAAIILAGAAFPECAASQASGSRGGTSSGARVGKSASSRPDASPLAQRPVDGRRQRERETLLHFCEQMDRNAPATIDGIRDRTDCWKRMQLEGLGDSLVNARYQAAVDDYDAATQSDSTRRASESSESLLEQRLGEAQRAIAARDFAAATAAVDAVLAAQPANVRARAYKDRVVALVRARQLRNTVYIAGAGVLLIALGLGIGARVSASRHRRALERERARLAERKAMVEIIDGLGRGKLYAISGPVFRIGAALSDRPEERNDLILSDESSLVSRYHCIILRKDDHYYLIDSSLNGTYLDDTLLERGEPKLLEDGDEFTVSGMARLKFLLV